MTTCSRIPTSARRAFTLIELIVVIVVLAILSGVAIPKYLDYSASAKASSCRATLGAARSAITNYIAQSGLNGAATPPALVTFQTLGGVMNEPLPANPYMASSEIAAATYPASPATPPPVSGSHGWNYDPASGRFWANSDTVGENTW
ncbi:MAG: prepilin-type N-terminal cleavage/methylation domain-containing protein [Phycisphaeraceae bacterium]|nr:prepilin-type N-terminal cleavage/methylation domain-containing protein [Phycisphaeraceae bacterium]